MKFDMELKLLYKRKWFKKETDGYFFDIYILYETGKYGGN